MFIEFPISCITIGYIGYQISFLYGDILFVNSCMKIGLLWFSSDNPDQQRGGLCCGRGDQPSPPHVLSSQARPL